MLFALLLAPGFQTSVWL